MNISKFFTREEVVSGVEVSDNAVRLVVLEKYKEKKKKPQPIPEESPVAVRPKSDEKKPEVKTKPRDEWEEKIRVKIAVEESLSSGVVVCGIIKDKIRLGAALKSLLKKSVVKTKYAILSIPLDATYAKVFSFPKNIQGERLEESMKLTIGFQLPVKTEDVYLDWESIKASDKNEITFASASQKIINEYVDVLNTEGIMTIAIEVNSSSIARVLETKGKEAVLIKNSTPNSTQIFVVRKGIPYFSRVLPKEFILDEKVEEEVRKISDFFESEEGFFPEETNLSDARITYDLYNNATIKENNGKWLASAGSALRGLMPRSEDSLISLMPVGTEEAYAYQKASTFVDFLSRVTIGVSVFFVGIFVVLWLFMVSMQQGLIRQVETISAIPVPTESVQLEARAQKINGLVGTIGVFVQTFPRWEGVIEEIRSRIAPGIFITSANLKLPEDQISISGVAQNRNQLNMFKRFLEGSPMFSEVNIPLTNLGQKENISFSATFKLKDPSLVYKR